MIALIGLVVGIIIGIVVNPTLPPGLQPYLPIMIVAALDAIFGAVRAYLAHTFSDRVLSSHSCPTLPLRLSSFG